MALPNFSQIVQNMITFITGVRPSLNTNPGTVANDVVISTVANVLSPQNGDTTTGVYPAILYTQELQAFVDNASTLTDSDLDAIGTNYDITRLPATQATGTETFRIRNYTVSSPIITVPAGTTVSTLATSTSAAVSFSTTTSIVFQPALAPSYFNPASGFYEQTAPITCQTSGVLGNVGGSTITTLVSSVPGIDAVTNTVAASGGTNKESNQAFASRIQIKLSGNNVGTVNGIISLVNTNPNVQEAIVVGPNDVDMQRDEFGGAIDVYIKGQLLLTGSDVRLYTTLGSQNFILTNQPSLSVSIVTGVVQSTSHTFIPGTDYVFVENPNSLFAGSASSGSYITFSVSSPITIATVTDVTHLVVSSTVGMAAGGVVSQGVFSTNIVMVVDSTHLVVTSTTGFTTGVASYQGVKPDNNTNITITYSYDSLIGTLQALFNNENNHIVASDLLVREAAEALINISESVVVVPGYVASSVVANIQTALTTYVNSLGLGASIPLSGIVDVTQDVPGVLQVDLNTVTVSSTVNSVVTTVPPGQALVIGKTAYTVANTINITVTA